ncbi:MAG: flippase-like domain-containing protein [bacterium]|nr:flippase-like domain-containing protein [bacterium]
MKLKITIGILISFAFLYYAFSNIDLSEFWIAIKDANYLYFIPAVLLVALSLIVRAYRWKYLLILQKDIKLKNVFSALAIGFLGNCVLAFRGGEIMRAFLIGKNEKISKSSVFATILVERIMDVLSLLILAVFVILVLPIPQNEYYNYIRNFGLALFFVELGIILFVIMLLFKKDFTLMLSGKILEFFPKRIQDMGLNIINSFIDGLEIIRTVKHYGKIFVTSFSLWAIAILQAYVLMYSLDMNLDINTMLISSSVAVVLGSFALTIPSSPGFVGTYHVAVQSALIIFSVDKSIAFGYAVLLHASGYLTSIAIGFYYFLRENIKFATMRNEENISEDKVISGTE